MGCSPDDDDSKQQNDIYGTWKLIKVYENPGAGSGSWNSVANGYTYTFFKNGEFSSTRFNECTTGTFLIELNKISLVFDCEGFTTGMEDPEGTFIEEFTFDSNNLILKPTYILCIEGCGWKFDKVE